MSNCGFQDRFGAQADAYRQFRPSYPPRLFAALAAAGNAHELAWDCATGSGQAALPLARFYESVLATDASSKQLSHAANADAVYFVQARAEAPCLKPASVDLLVVAQALHWFNLPTFFPVAKTALKPGAVFAAWTYNLMTVDDAINPLLNDFYHNTLGAHWSGKRRLVESGYADITLPFDKLELGEFAMAASWSLNQLCGYLSTWSALQHYKDTKGEDPLPHLRTQLLQVWGAKDAARHVSWPLSIKAGINR